MFLRVVRALSHVPAHLHMRPQRSSLGILGCPPARHGQNLLLYRRGPPSTPPSLSYTQVHADANLQRRGDDLHSELALDLWDALLGARLPVDTVRGSRMLTVPPGVGDWVNGSTYRNALYEYDPM